MKSNSPEARLGIIGCGHFGAMHAEAFSRIRRVRLVGFCNRTLQKAEALRERFQARLATANPDDIFNAEDINGVVIATQHDSHAELCISAAQTGKHVFVEKPLGMNLAECKKVLDAVGQHAPRIAVGYKLRFAPTIRRARELLSKPVLVIGQFAEDKWRADMWQQDPVKGGGSVLGNGCHTLDMICYLAQSRPVRVFAEGDALAHPGHPCLDHMIGTLVFENGALGSWIQGQSGTPDRAGKYQFSLFGGENIAIEVYNRLMSAVYKIGGRTEEMHYSGDEALHQQALAFIGQICNGQPAACDLWQGVLPNLLLAACERARQTRCSQEISWQADRPVLPDDLFRL